ncbi:MAG: hypothetical protein DI537_20665 [Stutzerimonas stutzeri]|nr:MAG: hypothetical protein DI537_20665 [Stutzerimonas stutzeri]
MIDDLDAETVRRLGEALMTMLNHKAEMLKAGERQRIAVCPRCGGSLRLALIGPKNHARMFCRGNDDNPDGAMSCGMQGME